MWSFLKITLLFLWTVPALGILQSDDSNQFDSLLIAAQKAQARGDYAAAANSYRQAVTINGDNPELWANLGLMENEPGNYSEAIQSFQNAARLNPSLYVPNLFLGIDYVHTGKPEKALPFLLKAERLNAADPQAPLALGRAYSSLGSFTEAVQTSIRKTVPRGLPSELAASTRLKPKDVRCRRKVGTPRTQKRFLPHPLQNKQDQGRLLSNIKI
jgi:tetratricopeptide (TPR) repeat protein